MLDTNVVLAAALFPTGAARKCVDKALDLDQLYLSTHTLKELQEKLLQPKFDQYASLADRQLFIQLYSETCLHINPSIPITASRDPKDNMFLELALAVLANAIITRDKDLLVLHPFRGVAIITAEEYLSASL